MKIVAISALMILVGFGSRAWVGALTQEASCATDDMPVYRWREHSLARMPVARPDLTTLEHMPVVQPCDAVRLVPRR